MYEDHLAEKVSQGDLFRGISLSRIGPGGEPVRTTPALVLLVTRGCEWDKPGNTAAQFVEVVPLSRIPAGSQNNVRQNRTRRMFFMASHDTLGNVEHFADLRTLSTVHVEHVRHACQEGNRLLSLTSEARKALVMQLIKFLINDDDAPAEPTP